MRDAHDNNECVAEMELSAHGNIYIVKILKNIEQKDKVIPYRLLVYNKRDRDDMSFINLPARLNYQGKALNNFLRQHLLIYRNSETNLIHYVAISKLAQLVEEEYPLHIIIWMQARIRGFLVRLKMSRKKDKGFVARFFMRDHDRVARVTVWKTLVKHTIKKTRT